MKTKLVLIAAMFAALVSSAQTNAIIFPQLLSPTNSVLMTNAEFRTFSGNKIFFKNDNGYQSFHAADLNTNVLAALHTSAAQLQRQQEALNVANLKWNEQTKAQSAVYQQQAASAARAQYNKEHPQSMYGGNYDPDNAGRTGWDGKHYHDNQSQGNFIGN